jgi:ribonuclease BN (tRNA processing enzyme)
VIGGTILCVTAKFVQFARIHWRKGVFAWRRPLPILYRLSEGVRGQIATHAHADARQSPLRGRLASARFRYRRRFEKLCYVTDAAFSVQNAQRIIALAKDADFLFIESVFLHEDADQAQRKCHLTARQAGEIARAAGARVVVPFHFSRATRSARPTCAPSWRSRFAAVRAASRRADRRKRAAVQRGT